MSKAERLANSLQERYEFRVALNAAIMDPFEAPPDPRDEELRDAAAELRHLSAEVETLRSELETERMRLAACGVVALADTPESAAKARDMLPQYRSASCDDVARRVDECMNLRGEVEALQKWRDEADILATYSRNDERREWVNVGVWLRPGEIVAHMAARPGEKHERS